jgi:hypothetical protein
MVGYDSEGNIRRFDQDGDLQDSGDPKLKYDEAYLLSVARLLNKDEMKKGSFYLQLDFAAEEPGQRQFTPVSNVETDYPLAANPSATFASFAEATGCPAGFFEYNAAANAAIQLIGDGAAPGQPQSADQVLISASTAGGSDIQYEWAALGTSPVPVGAGNGVEVFTGNPGSYDEALQNLANAINNSENLSAGGVGTAYSVGDDWVYDPTVFAAYDSVTKTLTLTSTVSGSTGESINVQLVANSAGVWKGELNDGTSSDTFEGGTGDITANLNMAIDPALDTVINSDDYRRISMIITDEGAQNDYRVNSPAGDYGILKIKEYKIEKWDAATNTISDVCVIDAEELENVAINNPGADDTSGLLGVADVRYDYDRKVGLVYYQAGVVAISATTFSEFGNNLTDPLQWDDAGKKVKGKIPAVLLWDDATVNGVSTPNTWSTCEGQTLVADLVAESKYSTTPTLIDDGSALYVKEAWEQVGIDSSTGGNSNATGFRRRMVRMAFNNTTELNSTIYFCRLNNNEFNYSANRTYLQDSKIRVKETTLDAPVSYITTVGLYSADNELLAQAKLSEPIRKDPTNEFVLRVRLDY